MESVDYPTTQSDKPGFSLIWTALIFSRPYRDWVCKWCSHAGSKAPNWFQALRNNQSRALPSLLELQAEGRLSLPVADLRA
jgi:hypothetical protein